MKDLQETESILSAIAKDSVNAIIITDKEEKILWVNDSFTRITEFEKEEVLGLVPGRLLQGIGSDQKTIDYMREQVRNKEPFNCRILNYSKTGRPVWLHIQGQPILDGSGDCGHYFAIETDVTAAVLEELRSDDERQKKLLLVTSTVLSAQEVERAAIGREMNENLGQVLGAASLYIELAKTDQTPRDWSLAKASEYITQVITEIQKMARALINPVLDLGLKMSISMLIEEMMRNNSLRIVFLANELEERDLSEKLQLDVFRIVQERLQNIIEFGSASLVTIQLQKDGYQLVVSIVDNGKGYDEEHLSEPDFVRLITRAELLGGNLSFGSREGGGIRMMMTVPYLTLKSQSWSS